MDHLAVSIAKLSQGRKNWYIGRESVPVDDSPGEQCEPVIVFECMDMPIGQRVNVSRLSCVSNKVLGFWDSYKVTTRSYVNLYSTRSLLSMRRWSKGRQFRSFKLTVALEVYL